jgi:hypothetical protein
MRRCLHRTFISSIMDSSPKPQFQRYFKMSFQTTMGTWYSNLASVVGNADAKFYTDNAVYKASASPKVDIGDCNINATTRT